MHSGKYAQYLCTERVRVHGERGWHTRGDRACDCMCDGVCDCMCDGACEGASDCACAVYAKRAGQEEKGASLTVGILPFVVLRRVVLIHSSVNFVP